MLRSNRLSYTTEGQNSSKESGMFSSVGEGGGAFVQESVHALLLVGGGEQGVEQPAFVQQPFAERGLEAAVGRFLDRKRGQMRPRRDRACP